MSSAVSPGQPITKKPCTRAMPCCLASPTASSICSSFCRLPSRSSIFCVPGLDAVGQHVAVGLAHEREGLDAHRVDPPFAAPVELELAVDDAVADVGDALALEEEVVVGEVDGAVALVGELLHLAQHVLRRPAAATCPRRATGCRSRCRCTGSRARSAWCRTCRARAPPARRAAATRCSRWAARSGPGRGRRPGPGAAGVPRSSRPAPASRQTRPATRSGAWRFSR